MVQNNKKVLFIEDDSALVDVFGEILVAEGFEVKVISSGGEALKKIKDIQRGDEKKPDIVLLDLILPDINGGEVLREIRANDATSGIIVFVLTNQQTPELQNLEDIKADEFIIKASVTPTQLLGMINKKLSIK